VSGVLRIAVTGREGQVARSLVETARGRDDVVVIPLGRPALDLARPETVAAAITAAAPDVVISAAAYTAVDKAESERDLAFAVNAAGAGAVAAAARDVGAAVLHLSTDYVFDGTKQAPYREDDATGPTGVYGASKLAGEVAVAAANPRHVILRTAWVYAPFGANFARTMLRLAADEARGDLTVVDDQLGCPTYAPDIAAALLAIAPMVAGELWNDRFAGVTHLAGPDAVTWCAFARAIMAGAAARGHRALPVAAIGTSAYPTPARRPANSRLDTTRFNHVFGARLPPLTASLDDCLDRLIGPRKAGDRT
jgi:dTDP-4-dehydrorhamnose reductase